MKSDPPAFNSVEKDKAYIHDGPINKKVNKVEKSFVKRSSSIFNKFILLFNNKSCIIQVIQKAFNMCHFQVCDNIFCVTRSYDRYRRHAGLIIYGVA